MAAATGRSSALGLLDAGAVFNSVDHHITLDRLSKCVGVSDGTMKRLHVNGLISVREASQ